MPCIAEWVRKGKVKNIAEAMKQFKEEFSYVEESRELKDNEYGINKND